MPEDKEISARCPIKSYRCRQPLNRGEEQIATICGAVTGWARGWYKRHGKGH
jgi:hypothetical protein